MQHVLEVDPRSGVLYHDAIVRSYEAIALRPSLPALYPRTSFREIDSLRLWVEENLEV